MSKFKKMEAEKVESEQGNFGIISAKRFEGLPIASEFNSGIVRLDGKSIKQNEDGTISAQVKFEDEGMNEHIKDSLIHISNVDRDNLEKLKFHMESNNIHITTEEKSTIKRASQHMQLHHLTDEEIKVLDNHLKNGDIHFDSTEQKDSFLNVMANSVNKKQEKSFKILVTDVSKNVVLSEIDSTVLENLIGLTEPIQDLLNKYAGKDHSHSDMLTIDELKKHSEKEELHFIESEKKELLDKVENLNGSLESMGESLGNIYSRLSAMNSLYTQNKLKVRYIRDTLFNRNSDEHKSLSWVNCAVYKNGKNITLDLPVTSVSTNMEASDEEKLAYINGDTTEIAFTEVDCNCEENHFFQIDLGDVISGITHIDIRHKIGESYEMLVEVSEDGENWVSLYDTYLNPMYEEDEYGKVHIINFEAYMNLFARI